VEVKSYLVVEREGLKQRESSRLIRGDVGLNTRVKECLTK
jgi:hypothetical protein